MATLTRYTEVPVLMAKNSYLYIIKIETTDDHNLEHWFIAMTAWEYKHGLLDKEFCWSSSFNCFRAK